MQHLLLSILFLILMIKSADILVEQSVALAKKLKISSFLVGFTLIALGTSLPELVISTYSTFTGHTDLAITNVFGSCIVNITLILGILALYKPYKLSKTDVFLNIPISLLALTLFILLLLINSYVLSPVIGVILIVLLPIFFSIFKKNNDIHQERFSKDLNLLLLILSLVAIAFLGRLSVIQIIEFSTIFNIKESILGYFIMAIGTSLPELITSLVALKKGSGDIGVGNILGSNLLNIYLILGSSALIKDLNLLNYNIEIFLLLFLTSFIVVLAIVGKRFYFSKKEGIILLVSYIIFALLQIFIF